MIQVIYKIINHRPLLILKTFQDSIIILYSMGITLSKTPQILIHFHENF